MTKPNCCSLLDLSCFLLLYESRQRGFSEAANITRCCFTWHCAAVVTWHLDCVGVAVIVSGGSFPWHLAALHLSSFVRACQSDKSSSTFLTTVQRS